MIHPASDHLPIDCDSDESMVDLYQKNRHPPLRQQVLEKFLPLVRRIASRLYTRLPRSLDCDDLVQAGFFGLCEALEHYSPHHHVSFRAYCTLRVRGAMIDDLRRTDWIPRHARHRMMKLEKVRQKMRMEDGDEPSPQRLAEAMGVDLNTVGRIESDRSRTRLVSLDRPARSSSEEGPETGQVADESAGHPQQALEQSDWLGSGWRKLSPRARQILELYYYQDRSMREIGQTLNLCESRVSQIHAAALQKMRKNCVKSA